MENKKISNYIESLYEKLKLTKEQYTEDTELQNFGAVVDDDVARMLQVLITIVRPVKILEIGTSIGFSTIMMAEAISTYGGKITTIELDEKVAEQAKKNFERVGVKDLIQVKIGDARSIIADMNEEFDLIFQDVGDKTLYDATMLDCLNQEESFLQRMYSFQCLNSILNTVI